MYIPNNRAPKNKKQNLTETKGETSNLIVIAKGFNILHLING